MIESFIADWPLFAETFVTLLVLTLLLALSGIPAVARDQIFAGAAASQAATLGIGLALLAANTEWGADRAWLHAGHTPAISGVVLAIGAFLMLESKSDRDDAEARSGWLFLAAGSLVIVLLYHTPVGMQEITARISSSVIGATWANAIVAGVMATIALLAVILARDKILLWMTDPVNAQVAGISTSRYRYLYALWLGITFGYAIHVAGLLLALGVAILPALAARHFCRTMRTLIWLAPVIALLCGGVTIVLASRWDLPLGPFLVTTLALVALLASWIGRLWHRG